MGDLATEDPTTRALAIMAAIARGEGSDDAEVRGWLARAVTAPRGPQWVCDKCHAIAAEWGPTCANCGAFDSLSWTRPPRVDTASPTGAEMLPLIVGAPARPEPEAGMAAGSAAQGAADAPAQHGEVVDVTDAAEPAAADAPERDPEPAKA
jgi:HemY protein